MYNYGQMSKGTAKDNSRGNIAYVDGQNLYASTTKCVTPWWVDLLKFRIYLKYRFNVTEAYYYLGYEIDTEPYQAMYQEIKAAGFILKFREHNVEMRGEKKGNVDTDMVFDIMKRLQKQPGSFNKIVLVSGDGDFRKLVDYLIEEARFEIILLPDWDNASSLYNSITDKYYENLSRSETIERIGKPKRKR